MIRRDIFRLKDEVVLSERRPLKIRYDRVLRGKSVHLQKKE